MRIRVKHAGYPPITNKLADTGLNDLAA